MGDLEDYELDRTGGPDEPAMLYRPEPEPPRKERGLLFPAMLALAAIAALGLLAVLYLVLRTPVEGEPTPPLHPSVTTPGVVPAPTPTATPLVLPPLDESDALLRRLLEGLPTQPQVARWLARSDLVRTVVVVTLNVATGETPRPHLLFLAPKTRFTARRSGAALVPDPASFEGYALVGEAVGSLDAGTLASTYRTVEPLFDAALRELGVRDQSFRVVLDRAIANLLAVPVLGPDVRLVRHATGFRYQDLRYESLSPAQKLFLRIGPRNVKTVQAKLRELAAALAAPPSPAESTDGH